MGPSSSQRWINFLALLPGTLLTVLTIAVAFLRFYDEQDFSLLGLIAQPRVWSNRFTVAAFLVAVVNFCVEWDRRNRETGLLAEAERRRSEEERRRAEEAARDQNQRTEEGKRASRRDRIQARCVGAQIRFQLDPSSANRELLSSVLAFIEEYGETL